jgi:hypothetical protein
MRAAVTGAPVAPMRPREARLAEAARREIVEEVMCASW